VGGGGGRLDNLLHGESLLVCAGVQRRAVESPADWAARAPRHVPDKRGALPPSRPMSGLPPNANKITETRTRNHDQSRP